MAYFISNTVYATDGMKVTIDWSVPNAPIDDGIVNVVGDMSIPDLVVYLQDRFDTFSMPVTIKTDGETLYIENNVAGEYIDYISVTQSTPEALQAFGGSWSIVGDIAEAANFGARLPFDYVLKSPAYFSYVVDQSGGVMEKDIFDRKLAGETYNGINKSSSSKVIQRTGWQFKTRFNEFLKDAWFWWLESCRNSYVTMVGVEEFGMDATVQYDIQPSESEKRSLIYAHLNIWEVNIALLGRPKI